MTTQSSTFWNRDGEDVEHFHGNHWHSFVEDTAQFMVKALPAAIQQARVIGRKPELSARRTDHMASVWAMQWAMPS